MLLLSAGLSTDCAKWEGKKFAGTELRPKNKDTETTDQCCQFCLSYGDSECVGWSWNKDNKDCNAFRSVDGLKEEDKWTSGQPGLPNSAF